MYLVLVAFFKVLGALGVQDVMPAALVCNTLCVNGALLLLYRVLRRLYGAKSALFGLAGAFLFLPFLLYGPIVYTDTFTLPFPIGALALWLSARERAFWRRRGCVRPCGGTTGPRCCVWRCWG